MYCTLTNIKSEFEEKELGNLSSDDGSGVVNEAYIEELIEKKSDYIDTYLRGSYTLPLAGFHTVLEEICVSLVKLALFNKREGSRTPEYIAELRRSTESQLDKLQRGAITLNIAQKTVTVGFIKSNTRTKIFNDDMLGQML